jgi:hypothetical protein
MTKQGISMKRRVPQALDLSILEFLTYGDKVIIAKEVRDEHGTKTNADYVCKVCKGIHRNDVILQKAISRALWRQGRFPMQVIKRNPSTTLNP